MPDFRHRVMDTDMFTPTTIRRFTWHDNGAVYGAPTRQLDGTTHLKNYFCAARIKVTLGSSVTIMSWDFQWPTCIVCAS